MHCSPATETYDALTRAKTLPDYIPNNARRDPCYRRVSNDQEIGYVQPAELEKPVHAGLENLGVWAAEGIEASAKPEDRVVLMTRPGWAPDRRR